jgi:hypothetical protein
VIGAGVVDRRNGNMTVVPDVDSTIAQQLGKVFLEHTAIELIADGRQQCACAKFVGTGEVGLAGAAEE